MGWVVVVVGWLEGTWSGWVGSGVVVEGFMGWVVMGWVVG